VGGAIAANPATGNIWITNPNAGTVTVIYPEYGPVATLPLQMGPQGVAIDPTYNRALIANHFSGTISVRDDTYLPGLWHPNAVAVDPATKRIFVTSRENDALFVLDGNTPDLRQVGRVATGDLPWGVAVDPTPGSKRVYVANFGSGTVQAFNPDTLALLKTFDTGTQPTVLAFNPVTRWVYTVSHGDNQVWGINSATLSGPSYHKLDSNGAWGVAVDQAHNIVCVSLRNGGYLECYNGAALWQRIEGVPARPCSGWDVYELAFNPDTDKLYAACAQNGSVKRLSVIQHDGSTWQPVGIFPVGNGGANGGGGIAVNTATDHVYFTNSVDGTVTVYDGHERLLGTLTVGADPFGAAADPLTNRIYVVLRGDNRVIVLQDKWHQAWLPFVRR